MATLSFASAIVGSSLHGMNARATRASSRTTAAKRGAVVVNAKKRSAQQKQAQREREAEERNRKRRMDARGEKASKAPSPPPPEAPKEPQEPVRVRAIDMMDPGPNWQQQTPPEPEKPWEDLDLSPGGLWKLWAGEKGVLQLMNQAATYSAGALAFAWVVFRIVGPALGWYQLENGIDSAPNLG